VPLQSSLPALPYAWLATDSAPTYAALQASRARARSAQRAVRASPPCSSAHPPRRHTAVMCAWTEKGPTNLCGSCLSAGSGITVDWTHLFLSAHFSQLRAMFGAQLGFARVRLMAHSLDRILQHSSQFTCAYRADKESTTMPEPYQPSPTLVGYM
jgi:hypothetical protein